MASESGAPGLRDSPSRPLVFALNGSRVQLSSVDPAITLLTYLRLHTRFYGTKLSCGEGGCGACLVLLSKYDVHSKSVEDFTINACLTLLCSLDGCAVTTTEGLGSTQKGFHAVHKRLAGFHGSQCGFCTPGMCIAVYGALRRAQNKECKGSILAEKNSETHEFLRTVQGLSTEDAQKAIVGNICRCTGYRPILDACRSFAEDVEVEDLGINTFWDSNKKADASLLPAFSVSRDPVFPEFLIEELNLREHANGVVGRHPAALNMRYVDGIRNGEERLWLEMGTLEAVFESLQLYQGTRDVKLVVGNTSAGYYKQQRPQVFIDISHVPELLVLRETEDSLEVGSAVTLEKLIQAMEARPVSASVCHGIALHVQKIANPHVRNRASVGGNLIMAQQFSFDSDLATLFLAVDVRVKLIDATRRPRVLSMEEFLQKGSLEPGSILESITIPLWLDRKSEALTDSNSIKRLVEAPGRTGSVFCTRSCFKSYRAAPRRLGNSLAFINAAFLADISDVPSEAGNICSIVDVRLAFGAFGQNHAIRAHETESFLIGKETSPGVLLEAIGLLKTELAIPLTRTTKASYRSSVAIGFLFEFFRPFLPDRVVRPLCNGATGAFTVDGVELSNGDGKANIGYPSTCSEDHSDFFNSETFKDRIYISGQQIVPPCKENSPLGKPMQKSEGEIQAAGEAVYVDDVPSPERCLFAAFVISENALAKVESVDSKLALASPGVVAYISAADIPPGGANVGVAVLAEPETLFATDVVEFVGQPLGIVVADTPQHAKDGAAKVRVKYDLKSLGSPMLSVEDAVDRSSFFSIPPFLAPAPVGDIDKGFSAAEIRIEEADVRTGSQYYFYMENQTALAVPDEDDCMLIYSSCQSPATLQGYLSTCLGVPTHNIRVITRRVGGGFGGKVFRNTVVVAACAVAAYKLRQPVRMQLDRNTDMIMMGGRHPTKTVYSVGFKSCGKVTALKAKVFVDAGWSEDLSPAIPIMMTEGLKKYNWGSMDVDYKVCRTNLSSKSTMRAPGHVQGSFIADTVIEHVAATLGLDVNVVIEENMHTLDSLTLFYSSVKFGRTEGYTLPSIWNSLSKRIEARKKAVHSFNNLNKWLKRGLSIIPCVYHVQQSSQPARVSIFLDGSVVVEVGGIELGQGLWTKVKQATIYALSQLWPGNAGILESVKVRVVQADSISLPHGGITSNSTTSEGSCESVRRACQVLVSKLMPVKLKMEEELSGGISWLQLIRAAGRAEVGLSAQIHWFPDKNTKTYLNYGAAASEVEVNVLTGETRIIQVDLIYDCGKSLNPAVDIGQIEGSFVQGIGFFVTEEHEVDSSGKVITNGTWTYKPPTIDNIPHKFFVEIINGVAHQNIILSSKACGEPPLLLAGSVHSAIRRAIEASREDGLRTSTMDSRDMRTHLKLDAPVTIEKVKTLCGLDSVEQYLKYQTSTHSLK